MDNKNREKLLLIGVAVAVGLYVLNMVVINPLSTSWTDRQKEIAELHTKITDGKAMEDHADVYEGQWNKMRTNTLPNSATLAENRLFTNFQAWEQASGVTPQSHRPQMVDSDDATFKTEEFKIEATGNINQIFDLLYRVESSPLGLRVDGVELGSRDDQGRVLNLGLTVSGLILTPTNTATQ